MGIGNAVRRALFKMEERQWDKLYVAVDLHDTVAKSSYKDTTKVDYYPEAVSVLQELSDDPRFCLILFTSSFLKNCLVITHELRLKYNIYFSYINSNPEVCNTEYGDFTKKWYYDLMLDDKAGFDHKVDWYAIREAIAMWDNNVRNR
jgi:hypothetical protein